MQPGQRLRFDRNELAGSFGDIGTDLPLIIGIILASGADSASVFVVFGLMQILTGVLYGLPMPMQPLKAMAVLVITQKLSSELLFSGGLAIGVIMLLLSACGLLDWLASLIPRCVVRGIQFGLGLSLCSLALKQYLPADGQPGYWLAGASLAIILALRGNRRFPAALFVIVLGVLYALALKLDLHRLAQGVGLAVPQFHWPTVANVLTGLVVLALPQLPLSLANSVIATHQTIGDLFPDRTVSVRKIGLTYGFINIVSSFFSGIPVCHGCGGLAGHYTFGARTGGSVVIYGSMYLIIGLWFSRAFEQIVQVFPKPMLAMILAFEGLALLMFIRDIAASRRELFIGLLVAIAAFALPQGYLIGLLLGLLLSRTRLFFMFNQGKDD
jgi:MFS superfamily sulfate permease-like transporter